MGIKSDEHTTKRKKTKAEVSRLRKENDKIFKSQISVEDKIKELMPENAEINWTKVNKWSELVNAYLKDMEKEANSNQLALAISATLQFSKHKRQLYVVPPGMGKSIIIAAFTTIIKKAYSKELTAIYIAFSC